MVTHVMTLVCPAHAAAILNSQQLAALIYFAILFIFSLHFFATQTLEHCLTLIHIASQSPSRNTANAKPRYLTTYPTLTVRLPAAVSTPVVVLFPVFGLAVPPPPPDPPPPTEGAAGPAGPEVVIPADPEFDTPFPPPLLPPEGLPGPGGVTPGSPGAVG